MVQNPDFTGDSPEINAPAQIENERLVLRKLRISDAPAYTEAVVKNRTRLAQDFPACSAAVHSLGDAQRFLTELGQHWLRRTAFHFGIWEKQNVGFAGEICVSGIDWQIPRASISYYVVEEREGKRVATEALLMVLPFAFDTLGMEKLQLRCVVDNLASQRVAEHAGFKIEGVLRKDVRSSLDNRLVDVVYYGMTSADYRSNKRSPH